MVIWECHVPNFKDLSDAQKAVINNLGLVMWLTGIGVLDAETIDEFVYRANLQNLYSPNFVTKKDFEGLYPITINDVTLSRREYFQQKLMGRNALAEFSKKHAKAATTRGCRYKREAAKRRKEKEAAEAAKAE